MRTRVVKTRIENMGDEGCRLFMLRDGKVFEKIRLGPNMVHAFITHADGSITDLGISHNLLTNTGRDLWAASLMHSPMKEGAFTATSATSATPSGGGLTADQYKGWRVYAPVAAITSAPVYGNIGTNSTTVLTVDQWWTAADGVGTTPSSTNGYQIMPTTTPRFMGISADAGAPAAGDSTLASEQTANGLGRTKSTVAHTGGTSTFTYQVAFSVTGTVNGLHKIGMFTAMNTTAGGIMVFESQLNQDANVGNTDTLTVTDTVTMSGT